MSGDGLKYGIGCANNLKVYNGYGDTNQMNYWGWPAMQQGWLQYTRMGVIFRLSGGAQMHVGYANSGYYRWSASGQRVFRDGYAALGGGNWTVHANGYEVEDNRLSYTGGVLGVDENGSWYHLPSSNMYAVRSDLNMEPDKFETADGFQFRCRLSVHGGEALHWLHVTNSLWSMVPDGNYMPLWTWPAVAAGWYATWSGIILRLSTNITHRLHLYCT